MSRIVETVDQQLAELSRLNVMKQARGDADAVSAAAHALSEEHGRDDNVLVGLHPRWFFASDLAPLMRRAGKPGFVVEDMVDVDEFAPAGIELPDGPLYPVHDVQRGDQYQNESPEEVLPQLMARARRPLTLQEGLSWALTHPEVIEANNCFMTIGSRKAKRTNRAGDTVYDTRTPAIWNASGAGRDGKHRKGAPKLGWCWWGNRHTWLGVASAAQTSPQ